MATDGGGNPRVPDYLGRVLDAVGDPAGTCFQVAPGVVVTAAHVLADVGADGTGAVVSIDPLEGGDPREATVERVHALADLAVLTTAVALDGCVAGVVATDGVALKTPIVVTGVVDVPDDHVYSHLDATGTWEGGATRDDQVPLGRLESKAVMRGMSGGPVRRLSDGYVVGVVSGRYNTDVNWLRDTVWVARTEHLEAMWAGLTEIVVTQQAAGVRLDLVLEVGERQVRLRGPQVDVSAQHGGVRPGLMGAVDDVRRRRVRAGLTRLEGQQGDEGPGALAVGRAGRLLAESFLPEPVAEALQGALARAESANMGVLLGVEVGGGLARLPWEALPVPGGTRPVALHPLIDVYRRSSAGAVRPVPGPLRILVAIASPEHGGGEVLDYERELRNVVAAVRGARAGAAHVRVVRFATTAAIRSALEAEDVHVLHISAHGSPGKLILEHDDGEGRKLDADTFVDEAVPPGRMPPLVCLAACHTNVAAAADAPSFAARLLGRGAAAVVATETSVTDRYSTRLFARIYGRLAEAADPDVVAAVCDARRAVQAELDQAKGGLEQQLALLDEWAVVTVAAPQGHLALFDPAVRGPVGELVPAPRIGLVAGRAVGDFVGRRREQRHWPNELLGERVAGMVLHGIGGIGKTTLAAELVAIVQAREPNRLLAQVRGEVSVEDVLAEVAACLRRHLLVTGQTGSQAFQVVEIVGRQDLGWRDRFALLRQHVLGLFPLLVVFDNFEDNQADAPPRDLTDEDLAELLALWAADPGGSRLLFTSRYPFRLPRSTETGLVFHQLQPLSLAETTKLVWSLPALDRLEPAELEEVWRMVGGHPRSLEYLDALLSRGRGRYPDITTRLKTSLTDKLGEQDAAVFLASERTLEAALAETAVLAADDVLLDDLLATLDPNAEALLLGASVYREPVELNALSFQIGEPDDTAQVLPDRQGAQEQIREILEQHSVDASRPIDLADLPRPVLEQLPHNLSEQAREPTAPRRLPTNLASAIAACAATTLLGTDHTEDGRRLFFVHRWTATELERRWAAAGRRADLDSAHRKAAEYWLWRVKVWPQPPTDDVHDLLETRHHLLAAGDIEQAGAVTETVCSRLDNWGAWDREGALILDTLRRLPETSDRRAAWIHQLGILAQARGDYEEAGARYRQSLEINERLGNQADLAKCYHQLGLLGHLRGDYEEAETRYRQSLEINERLGNQADLAALYHNVGALAQARGDYEKAEAGYRQALEINERLGSQAGMASGYHQLGMLAQRRGDYEQAETRYRQSLEIDERRENLAGMAISYHQLGVLAQARGEYEDAEARYRQSLEIEERLGNQAGIANSSHNLGMLAKARGDYEEAEARYRQSLEINERLGSQADLALGYHNVGILAKDRGDHEEAEARYRQSLEINERLGNQTGMASTWSQLGVLRVAQGDPQSAVGWHVMALSIWSQLDVSKAAADLRGLAELRRTLGRSRFSEALAVHLDDDTQATLDALLDELDRRDDAPDAAGS